MRYFLQETISSSYRENRTPCLLKSSSTHRLSLARMCFRFNALKLFLHVVVLVGAESGAESARSLAAVFSVFGAKMTNYISVITASYLASVTACKSLTWRASPSSLFEWFWIVHIFQVPLTTPVWLYFLRFRKWLDGRRTHISVLKRNPASTCAHKC